MNNVLFSLVLSFCSPVECQEFVIDHSLTESDCMQSARLGASLYEPIPVRVLYTYHTDKAGIKYMPGYPELSPSELKCSINI